MNSSLFFHLHDEQAAKKRAQSFKKLLDEPFVIEKTELTIGASIGVSVFPDHGDGIGSLLSHADMAMYEAKNNNLGICVYNPDKDGMTTWTSYDGGGKYERH